MKRKMILSVDVDHFPGSESGVQRILDILDDKGISSAFFITGKFGEEYPDVVKEINKRGHEIGCHGYSHGMDVEENFISMKYEEQVERISKSTKILGEGIKRDVVMFRAPYAKASSTTIRALESLGYKIDSSVTSRRFDFGMGVSNSIGAFFAPTKPYHPSKDSIFRKGHSLIMEVPISAFFAPLTLSAIRTLGPGKVKRIFHVTRRFFNPLVFYLHPWEVMEVDEIKLWEGVPKRHLKNRGDKALRSLESFINHIVKYVDFTLFEDVMNEMTEEKAK
jgi:peptidoglycan/xylan/chitin deacetylase (PgdA/CDA1 family)